MKNISLLSHISWIQAGLLLCTRVRLCVCVCERVDASLVSASVRVLCAYIGARAYVCQLCSVGVTALFCSVSVTSCCTSLSVSVCVCVCVCERMCV